MQSMLAPKEPMPPAAVVALTAQALSAQQQPQLQQPLPASPGLTMAVARTTAMLETAAAGPAVARPTSIGPASLTASDLAKLSAVLGPSAANFTRGEFITVPAWVTKDPEAGVPDSPCLYSAKTKFNVFLFEDGWRDAAPADPAIGGAHPCPLPRGGQLPLPEGRAPQLSVVLAFRNMPTETVRALLSVVHNAAYVASVEVLVLDIASSEEAAAEVKAFVQHLITHLDLRIRLFRFADPNTASLSRAVSKAAVSLATGEHLLIMNCDVALQPGSVRAMLAVFGSHPATGMVVPKFLQPSGQILDSGGLVFSDGSGWQYGRDEPTNRPSYNYVRPTDYGSSYCVMVLRRLFMDLKLYAPAYSPAWYDDTDAAFAIRAAGFNVYFTPFAEVVVSETADLVITSSKAQLLEANRNKFQAKWASVLSCHYLHETVASQYDAYIAATRLASFRLLFMDWIVPEPDRDSGSIRTINMLQTLLALRVHVTFAVKDTNREPSYTVALRYLGVEVVSLKELEFQRSRGAGCRYDLIIVARREVYDDVFDRLQSSCLAAPKVFDTVDLHFMRENKEAEFKRDHDPALLKAVFGAKNWNKLDGQDQGGVSSQTRELKYIEHSKVTVVVSEVETKEIRKFLPAATIVRISNIHADLDQEVTPNGFSQRSGAVFVGNWNHLPNRDAVLWFVKDILPLVHPHVDNSFVLHVVGANTMPPEISQLNNTCVPSRRGRSLRPF